MQKPDNQTSQEKFKKEKFSSSPPLPLEARVFERVLEKKLEKKEILTEKEKIIRNKLLEQASKKKLAPQLKDEVEKETKQLKPLLNPEEKIKHLLNLAQEKGVVFAIKVAQKLGDDYCLDVFRDILAKNSLYKQFKI